MICMIKIAIAMLEKQEVGFSQEEIVGNKDRKKISSRVAIENAELIES